MSKRIAQAVDRGLAIRKDIKRLQAELKEIEAYLQTEGLSAPHEDLKDADREGRRWLAHGTDLIVPVIFTADVIVGSFAHSSQTHWRITDAPGGGKFLEFFKAVRKFENKFDDGKKFRAAVSDKLGPVAPAFITACLARDKAGLPKSDIKILWDETEAQP